MGHFITLQLTESLLQQIKRRAAQAGTDVDLEIAKALEEAFPADEESLTPELASIMEALSLMEDQTLWSVASAKIPESVTDHMETLYTKRLAQGLSASEEDDLSRLEKMFEKNILVRAQAAMLLKERGLLESTAV